MAKLFVGNFNFSVKENDLRELFAKIGEVASVTVMKDSQSDRSRGFGFIEFENADDAKKAIEELNGYVWDGRPLKVTENRSQQERNSNYEYSDNSKSGPMGYFRAQPLDLGVRRKRKTDPFIDNPDLQIDYKDVKMLIRFTSESGRILPRRMTGLTSLNQRQIKRAIKRAQNLGLMSVKGDQQ